MHGLIWWRRPTRRREVNGRDRRGGLRSLLGRLPTRIARRTARRRVFHALVPISSCMDLSGEKISAADFLLTGRRAPCPAPGDKPCVDRCSIPQSDANRVGRGTDWAVDVLEELGTVGNCYGSRRTCEEHFRRSTMPRRRGNWPCFDDVGIRDLFAFMIVRRQGVLTTR